MSVAREPQPAPLVAVPVVSAPEVPLPNVPAPPPVDCPPVSLPPAPVEPVPVPTGGGGQPCESFHALSLLLISSVLSTQTSGVPVREVNSSIRSAKGMSVLKPGHVDCGVSATGRPSGSVMPLALEHVMRRTALPGTRTSGRPSCSQNSGSAVISPGEIVVNMRVRYGQAARRASPARTGSMLRELNAAATAAASHFMASIKPD